VRRGFVVAILVTTALAAGCASRGMRSVLPTDGDLFFVSGYHPYWAGDAWTDYPWDGLDELYVFEIEVGADGTVMEPHGWPDRWRSLTRAAAEAGVRVAPTVSMHDPLAFEELFEDHTRVVRLIDTIERLVLQDPHVSGLHLDVEVFQPVRPDARDGFVAFVAGLRTRLEALDPTLTLSMFVPAFDDDDVYNERALGQLVDFLVVQGYDLHSAGEATTGPVAGLRGWGRLNWDVVVDRFIGFGVPPRKIVMSIPLYGYEWPSESDRPGARTRGRGRVVPLAAPENVLPELPRALEQAALHGLRRDEVSGTPYYAFRDESGWWQGWFEDSQSLRSKYRFVRERGLGGVALFPLAYGNAALWADLLAAFAEPRF
jgi:spore germination protein YaaH